MFQKILLPLLLVILGARILPASGPENAIVVVNAESASSKLIANYYIYHRHIPPGNVVYLKGIPKGEVISVKVFRKKILEPMIKTIEKRNLSNQVDYIIYSSGFPTVVNCSDDKKKLRAMGGNTLSPVPVDSKVLNHYVSINSATYFLRKIIAGDPTYLSLNINTYARSEARQLLTQPFVGEDEEQFNKALARTRTDRYHEALEILQTLAAKHPRQLAVHYWLARTYAWQGDVENAILWLKRAALNGWCYRDYTKADTAFTALQNEDEFRALLAMLPPLPYRYMPSQSFSGSYYWGRNGMINSTPEQGHRFVLSTMLAVNRNQGNSEKESLRQLLSAIAADGSQPRGKFYFCRTSDVRSRTRSPNFDAAIEELRLLGHRGEIITTSTPQNRDDVAGLSMGISNFKWASSGSRILPGAICENLTSFGGRLRPGTKQTKLSEFLRYGAAGSSGTVIEPYAMQAKFPHPRIQVHYVRGCTLAESFYQSVLGPFQLLIVGDALCKPWARLPRLVVQGEVTGNAPISGFTDMTLDDSSSPVPIAATEIFMDGRLIQRVPRTGSGKVRIDTRGLSDGSHELRFIPIAAGAIKVRGQTIVPFVVANNGQEVKLKSNSMVAGIKETLQFSVAAPGATEIELRHNGRVLTNQKRDKGNLKVTAFALGRGPVRIQAAAMYDGNWILSPFLDLEIKGPISMTIPTIKSPPKSNKKKMLPDLSNANRK